MTDYDEYKLYMPGIRCIKCGIPFQTGNIYCKDCIEESKNQKMIKLDFLRKLCIQKHGNKEFIIKLEEICKAVEKEYYKMGFYGELDEYLIEKLTAYLMEFQSEEK